MSEAPASTRIAGSFLCANSTDVKFAREVAASVRVLADSVASAAVPGDSPVGAEVDFCRAASQLCSSPNPGLTRTGAEPRRCPCRPGCRHPCCRSAMPGRPRLRCRHSSPAPSGPWGWKRSPNSTAAPLWSMWARPLYMDAFRSSRAAPADDRVANAIRTSLDTVPEPPAVATRTPGPPSAFQAPRPQPTAPKRPSRASRYRLAKT